MKYNALLFCPDEKTARVVTQVLNDLEFRVEPCNEPFAAVKRLMAEHFDAIVVDCDSEQNAALLFKSAHNSGSNQSSLAVAVVEGQAGVAKAFRIGANLVLTKPINVEQSKGTLRVARGLLRKTDAAKPATATPAVQPPPRPVTSIEAKRPSAPQVPEPKPTYLPKQPLPSPIPPVSAALFEVESDPGPKPEPTEAALLESMPDPTPASPVAREYPWQPISKPAAEPMATALRRAAEATGRSELDASPSNQALASLASVSDTPISRSHSISMSSGQAAATAPAKIPSKPHHESDHAAMPEVAAPAFTSLGASTEPASGGSKKTVLIAVALLVSVAAVGYVAWTKMQPAGRLSITQVAPPRATPAQPQVTAVPPPQTAAHEIASAKTSSQPASALPIERGPAETLSTPDAHSSAVKKSTSIVAPNTVVRTQPDGQKDADDPENAPLVVKSEVPTPAPPSSAAQEPVQPPAPGSVGASNNQAISGIMSTTAATLPRPVPQQLKVSQGVSQGLLIKNVDPIYPALAKQMRVQGAVELLANIGKDGSITKVTALSGDPVLARAAIDAVKQWKYKPYYLDDQPVEIQTQITVNFKLP
ncbi:MAG: TonB family protein [Terriglobales bacterium]